MSQSGHHGRGRRPPDNTGLGVGHNGCMKKHIIIALIKSSLTPTIQNRAGFSERFDITFEDALGALETWRGADGSLLLLDSVEAGQ